MLIEKQEDMLLETQRQEVLPLISREVIEKLALAKTIIATILSIRGDDQLEKMIVVLRELNKVSYLLLTELEKISKSEGIK